MKGTSSWLILIAGPNGAGKTTFASRFLPALTEALPFINVDDLAHAMVPGTPTPDFSAGRLAVERIERFIAERRSFVIETTLAGRQHVNRLRRLRGDGWKSLLIYLGLRSPEDALRRVAQRVRAGGHDVAPPIVCRRFERSLDNLAVCAGIVDLALVLDNSGKTPLLIAVARNGEIELIASDRLPEVTARLALTGVLRGDE